LALVLDGHRPDGCGVPVDSLLPLVAAGHPVSAGTTPLAEVVVSSDHRPDGCGVPVDSSLPLVAAGHPTSAGARCPAKRVRAAILALRQAGEWRVARREERKRRFARYPAIGGVVATEEDDRGNPDFT
jgi:hypothetical protein